LTLPEFSSISVELLKSLKDKKTHQISDSVDFLADFFELTEEDRTKLKPSNNRQTIFHNRVNWTKYYLKQAGFLENPSRGKIKITKVGLAILEKNMDKMDRTFLINYNE